MQFHLFDPKTDNYSVHIIPFCDSKLQGSLIKTFPQLAGLSLPEKDEWILVSNDGEKFLLLAVDDDSHERKVADTFRNFAVKAKKYFGEKPLFHADGIEDFLEPALRGMALSSYVLGLYKESERNRTTEPKPQLWVNGCSEVLLNEAQCRADVQMRSMRLVDLPPCDKTPEILGNWALESAAQYGFDCEVWDDEKMNHLGLHAVNAVGKGSQHPPVFIVSRYKGDPSSTSVHVALVGKGVTFDTGGISIKPSENLHYMKCDMAGGAAVLGAIELAARLQLPINVTAVVPAAENAVDARSLLPGDIIHSYSGKTIEILNTDAEGRLILADALSWTVKNEKPKCIVDLATLTGSSVRALGKEAAALYTDNEKLSTALMQAGYKTGEKLWPMPLWSDYDAYLHSDVADVSNLPQSPVAGSIAAAKFLQVFTNKHNSWAHIDMPGPSFVDSPFAKMKSASGYGVQLLYQLMCALP